MTVAPKKPPAAAVGVNAHSKIVAIAAGTSEANTIKMPTVEMK